MLTVTFDQAIPGLLDREGGRSDDPHDSGRATKYGISLAFLEDNKIDLTGDGIVDEKDIEALTLDQAKEIYRVHFWDWLRCSDLPAPLALMVFDFGVNAGRVKSAMFLQVTARKIQVLCDWISPQDFLKVDGVIGPITMRTVADLYDLYPAAIIAGFLSRVLPHYTWCKTWERHGRGWIRRWGKTMKEVSETVGGA